MKEYKTILENDNIKFNIGKMAKQADASIFVSFGKTDFLVTVVKKELDEKKDFFPLIINYEEKLYSVGKIPGNYQRRESKPTDSATLKARLIDRPLRPLFPENFNDFEVQIVVTILGYDYDFEPEMIAISAASVGLKIAKLPLEDLVAGITIAKVGEEYIINPNYEQRQTAQAKMKLTGTKEAINMIEFEGDEIQEEEVLKIIELGHGEIKKLIKFQNDILNDLNVEHVKYETECIYEDENYKIIEDKYKNEFENILKESIGKKEKNQKVEQFKEKILLENENIENINNIFKQIYKDLFIKLIVEDKYRVDGRKLNEIRPLDSMVNVISKTHGSSLFTRGETQALAVCTLGIKKDEQILDGLEDDQLQRFLLHYNFPPYSVGETGRMGAPGRREIGHGELAKKSILPMLPKEEDFPYTIRIVSEILESNGSSSQATVCASTMALMDAGVPIKKPVAGIAMGLVKKDDDFSILSDIAGLEDHLGDMDFKVAGTHEGITAIQMDIKIKGINNKIFKKCLDQAKEGRKIILDHMKKTIEYPNEKVNENAPKIMRMQIEPNQIKDVIGRGGETINKIIEKTDVKIDIDDDGQVLIFGVDQKKVDLAHEMILKIVKQYKVGEKYKGVVKRIEKYGAFITFDGDQEALLHISNLSDKRVEKVEDVINIGDEVNVEIISVEGKNKIKVKLNEN